MACKGIVAFHGAIAELGKADADARVKGTAEGE